MEEKRQFISKYIKFEFIKLVKAYQIVDQENIDQIQNSKYSKRNLQTCTISPKSSQILYAFAWVGSVSLGDWQMLFTNSNPGSCPFTSCYLSSTSICTNYYSDVAQSCSDINLSVTSSGVLSVPNIGTAYVCCQYILTCQANSQTQASNPFSIYVSWAGMCNADNSWRSDMDVTASSSPPNKNYVVSQGISNIFQEEAQISDYFYFPNNFDRCLGDCGTAYRSCGCNCKVTPSCVIKSCNLVDSATHANVISQFQIIPYPNSTFVFQIITSSAYNQISVQLKCTLDGYSGGWATDTYFYSDSFLFQIGTAASTVITLAGSQQQSFDLANYVSFQSGYCSMFSKSITSCKILKYGSTSPYVLSSSLSGTIFNVLFDQTQFTQTDNFLLYCTLSNGLTFSNVFSIQITQCSPSISVNSQYSQTVSSVTAPFSVFTPTSSDAYPSYCSFKSFTLYDFSNNDVSSTTSPYSFTKLTGQFKITSFTGYFNLNFYVSVTNQVTSATYNTANSLSGSVNVLYQVDCTPSISGLTSISQIGVYVATPYPVFVASTYSTANNPTYCEITSYTLYDSTGTSDLSSTTSPLSFNTATGEFKITAFSGLNPNSYFTQSYKVQVNSNYISGSTSIVKSARTSAFTIDFQQSTIVTCTPTIGTISNFIGYVTSLTTPLLIFTVSQFSPSTSYSSYCVLSYSLYDSTGITQITSSSIMSFNSLGQFFITGFTSDIFDQIIQIKITSTYQMSINSIMSGQIQIQQVYCSPTITTSNQISSLNALVTPYSVFTASSLSSIQNSPAHCSLFTYKLLDSTGTSDLSATTTPYSFNTLTGEFKISSFTGYFYMQVIIQVTGIYSLTSSTMSSKSQAITIQYVVCTPQISGISNFINQVQSLTTPCTVFTASLYSSTNYPCTLSYNIYSYPSGTDLTSVTTPFQFSQSTGTFQVTSYSNNIFEQNVTIKVTSTYQSSSNSVSTSQILIRQVYCLPSINGLSSLFNYSINTLTFPYTVFKASNYASTTNPSYCSLSYNFQDSNGVKIQSGTQNISYSSVTGEFKILNYQIQYPYFMLQYINNIILQVISTFSSASSSGYTINMAISINIFTCNPFIINDMISISYNYTAAITVSPTNIQYILVLPANLLTYTASNSQFCKLKYELYFKSGLQCTPYNSQLQERSSVIGLAISINQGFVQQYYFKATAISTNPSYSNSVISKIFTVNVTIDPNLKIVNPYTTYKQNITFDKFVSNLETEYLQNDDCSILNTSMNTNGFNPNFLGIYQRDNLVTIEFKNFTTNNRVCYVTSHEIFSYDTAFLPKYLSELKFSGNIQSFKVNTKHIQFGETYKFKIRITATGNRGRDLAQKYDHQSLTYTAQFIILRNCSEDVIQQIDVLPSSKSNYFNNYKIISEVPVLFFNVSQKQQVSVDVSYRFTNQFTDSCSLNYFINQINYLGSPVNLTIFGSIIQLSGKGIFSIQKQTNYTLEHFQVFITAFNDKNASLTSSTYLIDVTIFAEIVKFRQKQVVNLKSNKTKLKKSQACYGFISQISSNGLVKIIFNDVMETYLNISDINNTNTQMYVKPGNNRQLDEGFDPSTLNFTWNVISFQVSTMYVQLTFDQPLEISPLIQQDLLYINFNGSQNMIMCQNKKTFLSEDYLVLFHNIRKQTAITDSTGSDGASQAQSMFTTPPVWLLAAGIVVVLIGYGNIKYLVIFIRSLQLIIVLPGLQVVLPANFMNYLTNIQKVSSYDILQFFNLYALPLLSSLQFDQNIQNFLVQQLQDVGYDKRNAMQGLATFTFLIILYFIKVILSLLMGILAFICCGRFYTKEVYQKVSNEVFFNTILSMSIEGLIDFIIFGYLNTMTAQLTMNGEVLGFGFGVFSLSMSGAILPLVLIILILTKTKKQIQSKRFNESWGALFENIKVKNFGARVYYLVFYLRRIIFLSICFFMKSQYNSVAVALVCFMNIIYTIYIGSSMPFNNIKLNKQEQFNEIFVSICTCFLMLFTDWVPKQSQKYFHGFILIIIVLFYSIVNVYIILYKSVINTALLFKKVFNFISHYCKRVKNCLFKQKNNQGESQNQQQIDVPNILKIEKEHVKQDKNIYRNQNRKIENLLEAQKLLERVYQERQKQILAKQQEVKRLRNENLLKSLDNLIQKPKNFIDPIMEQINEEIESNRENLFYNLFEEKQQRAFIYNKQNIQENMDPSSKATNLMNNHLYIKQINKGSIKNAVDSIFNTMENQKMEESEINSNISIKMESIIKELDLYQSVQPKKELKLIQYRISKFKTELEKYIQENQ